MSLYFSDYSYIVPFFLVLLFTWSYFFRLNFINVPSPELNTDKKLIIKNQSKSLNNDFFIRINKIMLIFIFICVYHFKFFNQTFWFNHLFLSSYNFYWLFIIIIANFIFIFILDTLILSKNTYKSDLFFTLINLSIILPIIFLCNTFYSFFFLLELNGVLIFYKFVVSKVFFKKEKSKKYLLNKIFPKHFINMLFFQYWTSFVSSVLLVYVLLNLLYKFGTSEWNIVNILIECVNKTHLESSQYFFYFLISVFIFSFFTKLGFTPIHLYKLEIYKGLPLLTIFFYTTYYFLVFFLYFCVLIVVYFNGFVTFSWFNLIIVLVIGCFYTFSLLFDINYIKAFFAYSTIINSLGFLCLTISLLN